MLQGEAGQEQTGLAVFMPQAVSVTQTLQVQSHFYRAIAAPLQKSKNDGRSETLGLQPKSFHVL